LVRGKSEASRGSSRSARKRAWSRLLLRGELPLRTTEAIWRCTGLPGRSPDHVHRDQAQGRWGQETAWRRTGSRARDGPRGGGACAWGRIDATRHLREGRASQ
jgi:hypothetical protein